MARSVEGHYGGHPAKLVFWPSQPTPFFLIRNATPEGLERLSIEAEQRLETIFQISILWPNDEPPSRPRRPTSKPTALWMSVKVPIASAGGILPLQ